MLFKPQRSTRNKSMDTLRRCVVTFCNDNQLTLAPTAVAPDHSEQIRENKSLCMGSGPSKTRNYALTAHTSTKITFCTLENGREAGGLAFFITARGAATRTEVNGVSLPFSHLYTRTPAELHKETSDGRTSQPHQPP